jgi:hypothetical protein
MSPKKNSAPQKKGGKGKDKDKLLEDPPVVVGGGSSVDVVFKDNATNPPNPPPGRKKFRLPNNITLVVIDDGTSPAPQLVRVSGLFKVSFF